MSECCRSMKCFHINVESYKLPRSSKRKTGTYDYERKYWGHIITNKACRTKERYAVRYTINGEHMSYINEEDFKKIFAPICEHIYEQSTHAAYEERKNIKKTIYKLSAEDCKMIFNEILNNSKLHEVYDIKKIKFKDSNMFLIAEK